MSTKSQSLILPFLILAGVLLAGAAVWKYTGSDEAESTPKVTGAEAKPVVTQVPSSIKKPQPQPVAEPVAEETPELFEPTPEPMSFEERQERKEVARNHMKFAMRYTTADRAISALRGAVEAGEVQKAVDLISFIEKTFPDATIPSDLLDL